MSRREKLLGGLDLARLRGAEIGPLHRPFVHKSDGAITYIDHADTDALRRKYADDPDVNIDEIAPVDVIWGDKTLAEALGETGGMDYVVASHVIEHVPDLIGWLQELATVLRPGGVVRLLVPDKRFCFDQLRGETRLTDVLAAHVVRARRPQLREVLDAILHIRPTDPVTAWNRDSTVNDVDKGDLSRALHVADLSLREYIDVHCWTFTPMSFVGLMEQLATLDMMPFACAALSPTEPNDLEFFVALVLECDPKARIESWRQAGERLVASPLSPREVRLDARCRALAGELDDARAQVAALRGSTSWRITAPLRTLVKLVRRV